MLLNHNVQLQFHITCINHKIEIASFNYMKITKELSIFIFSPFDYRFELLNVQKVAKEDKKQLRRCLKEHELKFLEANGRPMPKDELKEHEFYSKYKMTKAKLKLVDALLSKSVKP